MSLVYREAPREKFLTFAGVKLGLKLDPMKTQSVEKGGEAFHQEKHGDRKNRPEHEDHGQNGAANETLERNNQCGFSLVMSHDVMV